MTDIHKEILSEIKGSLGVITLNRPQALNALSIGMIKTIAEKLQEWEDDPAVKAVYFRGNGDRAFCAGGDIKQVYLDGLCYKAGEAPLSTPVEILYHEYRLNRYMHHYPKPMAVYMHGITMGGGYGLAGNCDIRIAAPDSRFAMPETGIGFFTDVGSVKHLQSCPHDIGRYLAISGQIIEAEDMLYSGIATHLSKDEPGESFIFKALENDFSCEALNSELQENAAIIEEHFSASDPVMIFDTLREDNGAWAQAAYKLIQNRSPLSVSICAAHYEQASGMSFDDVMATDFILAQHFMDEDDFFEGVRAVLMDKDHAPKWRHESVAEVTQDEVKSFFKSIKYDLNASLF